jgi:hypothetical protein
MKLAPAFKPVDRLAPAANLPPTPPRNPVGVMRSGRSYRLVALQPIAAGATVFRLEGELTDRATRYSVQLDENVHLDVGGDHSTEEMLDRYFWRFMNHSCDPNTVISNREVIALREIAPWTDITFNYNSTEYDMAEPFDCHCGAARCFGVIRGFIHLPAGEREKLRSQLAPYLRHLLPSAGESHPK